MNTYYELGSGVLKLIECSRSGDEGTADVTVRRLKDIVRKMDDKTVYSTMQMSIVFSELWKLPLNSVFEIDRQAIVVRQLREIYGEYNLVLGDLCKRRTRLSQTIEFIISLLSNV